MNCKTLAGSLLLLLCVSGLTFGHEVDHYQLPECDEFEDLGDYWNQTLYQAVCKGVDSLNREIEIAESLPIPAVRELLLSHLHSEGTVGWRIRKHLPSVLMSIEGFEWKMRFGIVPKKHADRYHGYRPSTFSTSYAHASLLPDLRQINRMLFMRASLLKVHGRYIGTDKIGHYITHGYQYFLTYRTLRVAGQCHEEAVRNAVYVGKYGPISEHFLVGTIPTGVYSNGDMAANYLGMKFFLSLMHPVMLQGCNYPSMLVRDGNYWRLRPHVTPEGEYFAAFVTEHLDEALNPSMIEPIARGRLRESLRHRAPQLLAWYAGDDPARRNPRYFDEIQQRCTTYFGEDYGHAGDDDELLTLGELCFDDDQQPIVETDETDAQTVSSSSESRNDVNVDAFVPESHFLDQSEIYTIALENPRDATFESVTITVQIPDGLYVTILDRPARFDRETNSLTWRIGEFEQGSNEVFSITAKAVKVGNYRWEIAVKDGDRKIGTGAYHTVVSPKPLKLDRVADRPPIVLDVPERR